MVSHLQHANPDSTVLMVGILPCAAETSPSPEGLFAWPNGLSAGISRVNEALKGFASQHNLVHYVDCTDEMLVQGQVRHPASLEIHMSPKAAAVHVCVSCVQEAAAKKICLPFLATALHHACRLFFSITASHVYS